MKTVLRWLMRLLLLIVLSIGGYIAYAGWAWRDLPVAELEQRYGDAKLRTTVVDGVPIRYRLEGQRDGPTLVLIHSHFFDMGIWDGWVEVLAPQLQILRFDLSGHGLTGPDPSGVYTVARDVELLASLLAQLGIDQAAIAGSSLGGNIAFNFAALHPEQTAALILINSGGLKRKDSRRGGEIPSWADHVFPLIPPAALHKFVYWMVADDSVVDQALLNRFVHMFRRAGNRPAELARLRQFETGDATPLLEQITAPTLILWGQDNPQLPVALATEFEQKLSASPKVERKIYPGAGHLLPVERPAPSAEYTLSFLRAVQAGAASETR